MHSLLKICCGIFDNIPWPSQFTKTVAAHIHRRALPTEHCFQFRRQTECPKNLFGRNAIVLRACNFRSLNMYTHWATFFSFQFDLMSLKVCELFLKITNRTKRWLVWSPGHSGCSSDWIFAWTGCCCFFFGFAHCSVDSCSVQHRHTVYALTNSY